MDSDNKVTVITSGASGIGAACAHAFAAKGARVVVVDINGDGAKKVADAVGRHAIACDVGKEADINRLVAESEEILGPVDI